MANNRKSQAGSTILEMNILPERYRRRKIQPGAVLAVILLLGQLLLLYPVSTILIQEQNSFMESKTAFQDLQAEVDSYNAPQDRIAELEAELESIQQELIVFEDSFSALDFQNTAWSEYLNLVLEQAPAAINVDSILFQDSTILVIGRSDSYSLPLVMVDNLEAQERFSEARALSIQVIPPEDDPLNSTAENNPETNNPENPVYSFEIEVTPDMGK
jgi:Tfp pilus assembly protein PilN